MKKLKIDMKDNNYINIQFWMVGKMQLKGNELLAYALIYGFSQDGRTKFTGSQNYISEWLNVSRSTTKSVLKSLAKKGLLSKIDKVVNGVKFCEYIAIVPDFSEKTGGAESDWGRAESGQGGGRKLPRGRAESGHNNLEDSIDDNLSNNLGKKEKPNFGKSRTDLAKQMILEKNPDYSFSIDDHKHLKSILIRLYEKEKKFREKKKMQKPKDHEVVAMLESMIDNLPKWVTHWDLSLIDRKFNSFIQNLKNGKGKKSDWTEQDFQEWLDSFDDQ